MEGVIDDFFDSPDSNICDEFQDCFVRDNPNALSFPQHGDLLLDFTNDPIAASGRPNFDLPPPALDWEPGQKYRVAGTSDVVTLLFEQSNGNFLVHSEDGDLTYSCKSASLSPL
jgi:hypothetical protein